MSRFRIDLQEKIISRSQSTGSRSKSSNLEHGIRLGHRETLLLSATHVTCSVHHRCLIKEYFTLRIKVPQVDCQCREAQGDLSEFRICGLCDLVTVGCPGHGPVHSLVEPANEIGFSWNSEQEGWEGYASSAYGPVQHFRKAVLAAGQDKVAAEHCDRQGCVWGEREGEFLFDLFGSHQILCLLPASGKKQNAAWSHSCWRSLERLLAQQCKKKKTHTVTHPRNHFGSRVPTDFSFCVNPAFDGTSVAISIGE